MLHTGSHRAGKYPSSKITLLRRPQDPPSLIGPLANALYVLDMHWVKLWTSSCNTNRHTFGFDGTLLALTLTSGQLLVKKTQGSAWCCVKKGFILLNEDYVSHREIQNRGGKWFEWHFLVQTDEGSDWHLNIQITNEHTDMYSFTAWHEIIILFLNKIRVLLCSFRDKSRQTKTQNNTC